MEYLKPDPVVIRIEIDMSALLIDVHEKPQQAREALDAAIRHLYENYVQKDNQGWCHRPKKIIDKLDMYVGGEQIHYARISAIPREDSGFRNIRKL